MEPSYCSRKVISEISDSYPKSTLINITYSCKRVWLHDIYKIISILRWFKSLCCNLTKLTPQFNFWKLYIVIFNQNIPFCFNSLRAFFFNFFSGSFTYDTGSYYKNQIQPGIVIMFYIESEWEERVLFLSY